jgi:hypothetical protein
MASSDPSGKDSALGDSDRASRPKKAYQKPAVRFERVFETMALTCGKVDPGQGQCSSNRKVS